MDEVRILRSERAILFFFAPIYGANFQTWPSFFGHGVDQIAKIEFLKISAVVHAGFTGVTNNTLF